MNRLPPPPPQWGDDPLTAFIDNARNNAFATYANRNADFTRLKNIDVLFRDVINALLNAREMISNFLLLRSHSSYLAGCCLVLSGQTTETFMVLRGCLEAALYALFVCGNEYRQELWLRRDENDSTKRDFRNKFTAGNVLNHLRTVDPKMGRIAGSLYDHTLDYGAHPNRDSILPLVERVDSKGEVEHRLKYLAGEGLPFENALRTTAQVGLVALRILRNVYKERFNIMGFTDRIEKASIGL